MSTINVQRITNLGTLELTPTFNLVSNLSITGNISTTLGVTGFPAFNASSPGTQTVTASTWTLATLSTENFDTNNNFASNRFTPTVAGYYQFNAYNFVTAASSLTFASVAIYKNGSSYKLASQSVATSPGTTGYASLSDLVYMNGTTDYVELYVRAGGSGTLTITEAYLSGFLARGI